MRVMTTAGSSIPTSVPPRTNTPVRQLHARRPQHDDRGEREGLTDGEEPEEEGGKGTAADEGDDPGRSRLDGHCHA
jgi:hypothetical protein